MLALPGVTHQDQPQNELINDLIKTKNDYFVSHASLNINKNINANDEIELLRILLRIANGIFNRSFRIDRPKFFLLKQVQSIRKGKDTIKRKYQIKWLKN